PAMWRSAASNWSGVISVMAGPPSLVRRQSVSQHDLHAVLGDVPTGGRDPLPLRRSVDQDRVGVVDVNEDAPCLESIEGGERAVGPVDRHVAHAAAGLLARSTTNHLVVGE